MTFDELIRYKALHLKYISDNQGFLDMVVDQKPGITANIPMKNVCAMVTQDLFDELTSTCGLLDISKRAFIEAALLEALSKANSIVEAEGLEEHLVSRSINRALQG